jgi:hypothetical protein
LGKRKNEDRGIVPANIFVSFVSFCSNIFEQKETKATKHCWEGRAGSRSKTVTVVADVRRLGVLLERKLFAVDIEPA